MKLSNHLSASASKSFRMMKKTGFFPLCLGSVFISLYLAFQETLLSKRGCFAAVCTGWVAVNQTIVPEAGYEK